MLYDSRLESDGGLQLGGGGGGDKNGDLEYLL
jgi:hypothetical protein